MGVRGLWVIIELGKILILLALSNKHHGILLQGRPIVPNAKGSDNKLLAPYI